MLPAVGQEPATREDGLNRSILQEALGGRELQRHEFFISAFLVQYINYCYLLVSPKWDRISEADAQLEKRVDYSRDT